MPRYHATTCRNLTDDAFPHMVGTSFQNPDIMKSTRLLAQSSPVLNIHGDLFWLAMNISKCFQPGPYRFFADGSIQVKKHSSEKCRTYASIYPQEITFGKLGSLKSPSSPYGRHIPPIVNHRCPHYATCDFPRVIGLRHFARNCAVRHIPRTQPRAAS